MEDINIIDLYWRRSETAIDETDKKYGRYCRSIAYGILENSEDSEECVDDTYMATWNSLPPQRPKYFPAYLGRITRNLSLTRIRASLTQKRGAGEVAVAYDELSECVAGTTHIEREYEQKELIREVEQFLYSLSKEDRLMFMYRYWLAWPVADIAKKLGCTESRVKSALHRSRQKLRQHLVKEGLL